MIDLNLKHKQIHYRYNKLIDYLNKDKPKNFKFLHIPKTGGTYIRSKLSWDYIDSHDNTVSKLAYEDKLKFDIYTTIRNPFSYYNSVINEFYSDKINPDSDRFEFLKVLNDNTTNFNKSPQELFESLLGFNNYNEEILTSEVYIFGRSRKFKLFKYLKENYIGIYTFYILNHFSKEDILTINSEEKIKVALKNIKRDIYSIKLENIDKILKKLSQNNKIYLKKFFVDKNKNKDPNYENINFENLSDFKNIERHAFKFYEEAE